MTFTRAGVIGSGPSGCRLSEAYGYPTACPASLMLAAVLILVRSGPILPETCRPSWPFRSGYRPAPASC